MRNSFGNPGFIADVMLGRLARWLRLLGFDTLYDPHISDSGLLRVAREQGRVILTRDTRLVRIKGVHDYLLIKANDPFKQLLEVVHAFNLKDFLPLSRCGVCNGELSKIPDKREIRDSIPDFVFHNFHNFLRCSDCRKIYWEGTHPGMFKEKLTQVIGSHPLNGRTGTTG